MSVATQVVETRKVEIPWGELEGIVGVKNVLRAKEDLIPYGFDGTAAMSQSTAPWTSALQAAGCAAERRGGSR